MGLRFNEPLPVRMHHTISVGYVRNGLSQQFVPPGSPPFKAEQSVDFNTLIDVVPMILLQPVIQYYANPSGGPDATSLLGSELKWTSTKSVGAISKDEELEALQESCCL